MTIVGTKAPNFVSTAVMLDNKIINDFNFREYIKNNICILFFWSMNFNKICTNELIKLNKYYKLFYEKNVRVICVSCDSELSHIKFKSLNKKNDGLKKFNYIMISDKKREIIKFYDVENINTGYPFRSIFIINKKSIIVYKLINLDNIEINIVSIVKIIKFLCK